MDEKYIKDIYNDFAGRYGAKNILPYDQFRNKVSSDSSFARQTYDDLAGHYGKDNILGFEDFHQKVKTAPTPQQPTKMLFPPIVERASGESTHITEPTSVKIDKLHEQLPAMKKKAVSDIAFNNLLKQGKIAPEGSPEHKKEMANVAHDISDKDWMPSFFQKGDIAAINKKAVDDFSSIHKESPESVKAKVDKGDYVIEDGKVKEKGGFLDNLGQSLKDFTNNIGLALNVEAAKANKNTDAEAENEIKYHLNEFNKNKQNDREFAAADLKGKAGKLLGGVAPFAVPYADVPLMALSNLGNNHQEIWNDPNLSEDQKVKAINSSSKDALMIGAMQGLAFRGLHSPEGEAVTKSAKEKFTQRLYYNFSELARTTPKEVAKSAGIFGATEAANQANRGMSGASVDFSKVPEAALEGAALDLLMKSPKVLVGAYHSIAAAKEKGIDASGLEQKANETKDAIASAPEPIYKEAISQLGDSNDPTIQSVKEDIEKHRAAVLRPEEMNSPEAITIAPKEDLPSEEASTKPAIILPENNREPNIIPINNEATPTQENAPATEEIKQAEAGRNLAENPEGIKPSEETVGTGLLQNKKGVVLRKEQIGLLDKLGYSEEEIDNLSQPEVDHILSKNIEKPVVENSAQIPQNEPTNTEPTEPVSGKDNMVGVHHAALTELAKKLELPEPERGNYIEPERLANRGRKLLEAGADPNEVNNSNNELHDRIAIARAHLEDLSKAADNVAREKGVDSPEYKEAALAANDYANNVVKKLGTNAHYAMVSLQGTRDIDTGSFTTVKHQVQEASGRPATPAQEAKIKILTEENTNLKKQVADTEKALIEATDKAFQRGVEEGKKQQPKTSNSEKAKSIANKLREKAKLNKPDVFSAATPASLVWDAAIEVVATSIEAGGKLADAIEAGVRHIQSTDWYKQLSEDKRAQAESEFRKANHESVGGTSVEDLQARFADKKDTKFTHDEAKSIWEYAQKAYLDKGVSYRDAIGHVMDDLGLTWRQVSEAFVTPKGVREIDDALWKKQAELRRSQNATKRWIDDQNKSTSYKVYKKASDSIRGLQVFGHGGIFVGTHAGMTTIFMPSMWGKALDAFVNGYKFAYGKDANYERAMEELKHRDNYVIAQRYGLKNNPERINVEEFQKSQSAIGKFGHAGEKGFNAIKVLRQDIFDYHYDRLTDEQKSDPQVLKNLARLTNNATGATNVEIPNWVNEATFAGGMEVSRWEKLIRNPAEATNTALRTLLKPEKASVADKVFARVWARRVGEQLATFGTMLAMNALIQKQVSPNNPVNLTDPSKNDFLKFKFGKITIDPTSGMVSVFDFIVGLTSILGKNKRDLRGDTKLQAIGKKGIGYARGKLSPFAGTAVDLATQADFNNNQLPWSNIEPSSGKRKISWLEYGWEKMPLPVAEAAKVVYQSAADAGADKVTLNDVLHGIALGALSGGTGFRVGEYENTEAKDIFKGTPEEKFIVDNKLDLVPFNPATVKIPKDKDHPAGRMKKEEAVEFSEKRDEKLKEAINYAIKKGIISKDNSQEDNQKELKTLERLSTEWTRKQKFPKAEKTDEQLDKEADRKEANADLYGDIFGEDQIE